MPTPFANNLLDGQLTQASQPNQYGGPIQSLESGQSYYQVASGRTNAYEVLFPPPLVVTDYTPGMIVNFLAHELNTQSATLKVNGLPPQLIVKNGGDPLDGGEISANQIVSVIHDGTQFQLVGGEGGGVTSFIGRTGTVLPQPGDYDVAGFEGTASAAQGGTGHNEFETGDLLVANGGTELARLPAGGPGEILTADNGQPLKARWATPPSLAPPPYLRGAYPLQVPTAGYGTYGMAVCTESDPPILAVIGVIHAPPPRQSRIYFFYRVNHRWRPVPKSGIGVEKVGGELYSISGPLNTNPSRVVYVSSGGTGPGRGKFWIGSETNEYIRVVNPANLSYDDYQLHPDEAVLGSMAVSPDGEHVFAIAGNGTRLIRLNTDSVTVEADRPGFTNLTNLCLQTDNGITSRVWVTRTGGGSDVLQWLDAGTLVPTTTGWAPTYTPGALVYIPELGIVLVSAQNDQRFFSLIEAADPYDVLMTHQVGDFGMRGLRLAYVPSVGLVARPDVGSLLGIDRATGSSMAKLQAGILIDILYEPTYREFYVGTDTHRLFVAY